MPQAFFLPASATAGDQRLCLFHAAQAAVPRGLVVYVPPFAEEMNKARRMAALQARALAQAGYSVLQIDLLGCGDSSGDFGDAGWQDWIDDVRRACAWLRQREPAASGAALWLWGLRAGCLLAAAAAPRLDEPAQFCFWQPMASGRLALQQFLRLKLAGALGSGNGAALMETMKQQLARGESVEIAGYRLSAALANGLESAQLLPDAAASAGRLEWLELSTQADAPPSPVSLKAQAQWQQAGYQVRSHRVQGPAFWQTSEIEDAPALLPATLAALQTPALVAEASPA